MFKNMLIHFFYDLNRGVLFKCLKQSTLLPITKANLATKTKTHYETLGLQPTATYNEIKSAYYELTLKYHPDKNKSESAREMFHEISNAYDVLSKYETRKQYDRTLLIKQDLQSLKNKKHEKYKPRNTQMYTSNYPTDIFNFDEWIKQHYSETFQKNILAKKEQKIFKEDQEILNKKPDLLIIIILIILMLVVFYIRERIDDRKYQAFKAAQRGGNK